MFRSVWLASSVVTYSFLATVSVNYLFAQSDSRVAKHGSNKIEGLGEKPSFANYSMTASPDGKVVAIGRTDGNVCLYGANPERLLRTLKAHFNAVTAMAFSPDGKTLVTGSYDGMGEAKCWWPAVEKLIHKL